MNDDDEANGAELVSVCPVLFVFTTTTRSKRSKTSPVRLFDLSGSPQRILIHSNRRFLQHIHLDCSRAMPRHRMRLSSCVNPHIPGRCFPGEPFQQHSELLPFPNSDFGKEQRRPKWPHSTRLKGVKRVMGYLVFGFAEKCGRVYKYSRQRTEWFGEFKYFERVIWATWWAWLWSGSKARFCFGMCLQWETFRYMILNHIPNSR